MAEASLPRTKRFLPAIALPAVDATRACLLFVCVLFFSAAMIASTDPDYWWHLRTGRLIVEDLAVPSTDPFSFTRGGEHWVAHEWLSEVLIYGIQSLGGYGLAVVLFASVALSTLLLAYRTGLSLGASRKAGLLFFVWAGVMMVPYWTVRPQVLTWFLFAAFIAVCLDHRAGKNRLWLLPPLMVLWANLHLGYAYGLAVLGLYAFSLTAERFFWKEQRDLKPVFLTLGACIAATLLTPSPVELLLYPLEYIRPGNTNLSHIVEWRSPDFHKALFAPLALALVSLLAMGVLGKRRDLFLPLLALLFGFLALQSIRNQPLFAIVFVIVGSQRASELWSWAAVGAQQAFPKSRSALNLAVVTGAALLLAYSLSATPAVQLRSTARVDGDYPRAGAHFIRDNYPEARVFNDYAWGGYLINELYPKRVFIDGRSDFYGDKLMNDYSDVAKLDPRWADVLAEHDIELILIESDSPLAVLLATQPQQWQRVFTGDIETVFARADVAR